MKNLQSILGKQMCMYEMVLHHMEKTILWIRQHFTLSRAQSLTL